MNKQIINYRVMAAVEKDYVKSALTDGKFAAKLSQELNVQISTARVRQARVTLGIPSNNDPDLPPRVIQWLKDWDENVYDEGKLSDEVFARLKEMREFLKRAAG